MNKAYKYRIYPTPQQEEFFRKEQGICRLYWNVSLAQKNDDHKTKLEGPLAMFQKYKPEAVEYYRECDSWTITNEWSYLTKAFNNFFGSVNKTRKGKFVKPPKFKSRKTDKLSLGYHTCQFKKNGLFLTRKVGILKGAFHCRFCEGKLKSCTISQNPSGKWFVSILVEKKEEPKCQNRKIIGVDWNCGDADFLVRSDGVKIK
jgi:putative transposase